MRDDVATIRNGHCALIGHRQVCVLYAHRVFVESNVGVDADSIQLDVDIFTCGTYVNTCNSTTLGYTQIVAVQLNSTDEKSKHTFKRR